jgi:hypothetical protein
MGVAPCNPEHHNSAVLWSLISSVHTRNDCKHGAPKAVLIARRRLPHLRFEVHILSRASHVCERMDFAALTKRAPAPSTSNSAVMGFFFV